MLAVEYMSLPASQYSVLDAERIERVDDNTFTLLNSSTLKCVLFCSLGSKSKLMAAASSSCLARLSSMGFGRHFKSTSWDWRDMIVNQNGPYLAPRSLPSFSNVFL
ncbi:hypothetical protein YC2023_034002 [Brassica napus]